MYPLKSMKIFLKTLKSERYEKGNISQIEPKQWKRIKNLNWSEAVIIIRITESQERYLGDTMQCLL